MDMIWGHHKSPYLIILHIVKMDADIASVPYKSKHWKTAPTHHHTRERSQLLQPSSSLLAHCDATLQDRWDAAWTGSGQGVLGTSIWHPGWDDRAPKRDRLESMQGCSKGFCYPGFLPINFIYNSRNPKFNFENPLSTEQTWVMIRWCSFGQTWRWRWWWWWCWWCLWWFWWRWLGVVDGWAEKDSWKGCWSSYTPTKTIRSIISRNLGKHTVKTGLMDMVQRSEF